MADQERRKQLDRERPIETFEQILAKKMDPINGKGLTYEEALKDIALTAATTNPEVNSILGVR